MELPNKNYIELQNKLTNLLLLMGANPYHIGYKYIKDCIIIVMQKHGLVKGIVKELYIPVAETYNIKYANVERSIRHLIGYIWNKSKVETLNKAFGLNIFARFDIPTNGQLIMLLAEKLSQEFMFVDENTVVRLNEITR